MQEHKKKREFFFQFSENPIGFMDKMIFSQTRDLILMSPHKEREESRHSTFFEQNWVDEAVNRYLEKKDTQTQVILGQSVNPTFNPNFQN